MSKFLTAGRQEAVKSTKNKVETVSPVPLYNSNLLHLVRGFKSNQQIYNLVKNCYCNELNNTPIEH